MPFAATVFVESREQLMEMVRFKHARFSARFPADFLYSKAHYWLSQPQDCTGAWHIGFTKFATRMLGELVDAHFEKQNGDAIAPGETIGYVEGFKAASDVYCVVDGTFLHMNPVLQEDACIVRSDPYTIGWLYAAHGSPEPDILTVHDYIAHLETIITRLQNETHHE